MFRSKTAPLLTPPDGGGKPEKPKLHWYYDHIFTPPTPEEPPHVDEDAPAEQSTGQASSSDPGRQSGTGSDKSEKTSTPQQQSLSQPAASGFPQDIEWSPEDDASGLETFMQATAQGTRDSSEDKTTVVCEALYAADPEGVARGLKFITGCEVDDEEQDVLPEFIRLARRAGLDEYLAGVEAWNTTRLSLSESFAATATDEEQSFGLSQPPAKASADEAPEINIFAHEYLSETESGWDPTRMKKKELDNNVLIPKLKLFIHDFDENAVNWDDFTFMDSIDFYSRQIREELYALSKNSELPDEYYQQVHAELEWATELRSLAEPKAVDYTEVYAASFAGTVHVPDAEHERTHVVDQLALIHEELNITVPDGYFESRSTRELKHDLAYLLQDEVLPFLRADENEEDNRIGNFYRRYQLVARDTPENVLGRLVGSNSHPDVAGFLLVMGLTMAIELLDWGLAIAEGTDALLRGDLGSAMISGAVGVVPGLSNFTDDAARIFLKAADNIPLLPARAGLLRRSVLKQRGFTDEMIDMFENLGATGPGTGVHVHKDLRGIRSADPWETTNSPFRAGVDKHNANFVILRDQYRYNIVHKPNEKQLTEVGFYRRTTADGRLIDSTFKEPDYIIEGRVFDAYTISDPKRSTPTIDRSLISMERTIRKKVPAQTNRMVIDLSYTPLTSDVAIERLASIYAKGRPIAKSMPVELEEIIFMKDGQLTGVWVQPRS